jgi:hypothetical protein
MIFLSIIKWLAFLMGRHCVSCELKLHFENCFGFNKSTAHTYSWLQVVEAIEYLIFHDLHKDIGLLR